MRRQTTHIAHTTSNIIRNTSGWAGGLTLRTDSHTRCFILTHVGSVSEMCIQGNVKPFQHIPRHSNTFQDIWSPSPPVVLNKVALLPHTPQDPGPSSGRSPPGKSPAMPQASTHDPRPRSRQRLPHFVCRTGSVPALCGIYRHTDIESFLILFTAL